MGIFPPANSGTSGSKYNPRNTQCMDACPAVFKRGGYNFRLPPLKVRDLRLDLGKNISFSDSLLRFATCNPNLTSWKFYPAAAGRIKQFF